MPQKTRRRLLLRAMIYYAIENDIIPQTEIIKKHSLRMPSSNVTNVLDRLTDPTIKNVFDLFSIFIKS